MSRITTTCEFKSLQMADWESLKVGDFFKTGVGALFSLCMKVGDVTSFAFQNDGVARFGSFGKVYHVPRVEIQYWMEDRDATH